MGRGSAARVVVPPAADAEQPLAGLEPPGADEYVELEDPGDIAALQDARFESWVWYVWRQPPAGQVQEKRDASRGPSYVLKLYGPLDIEDIRARCGGGYYKIGGYVNGTKRRGFMLQIDGPPRVAPIEPAPHAPAAAAPSSAAPAASELAALTTQLGQAVTALTDLAHRPPPAAAPGQGMGLKELLQLLPLIQREPAPAVGADTLKELVGVLRTGIELGQSGAGGEANPWLAVVDRLAPTLQTIAANMARRGGPPRRGARGPVEPVAEAPLPHPNAVPAGAAPAAEPAPAASGSSAAVIEDAPEADDARRWTVAVEALARAVAEGVEPDSFAAVLEHILSDAQLGQLVVASTDQVMAELAQVSDRFPVLASPEARAFVDAVLTELRSVEDEAPQPPD